MEVAIERLLALCFLVIGLSHIAAPAAWTDFFLLMRRQEKAAGLINAYVHFPVGALVVSFHWIWHGLATLVTLLGCFLTLKGAALFIWPQLVNRSLSLISHDRDWGFRVVGAVMVGLAVAAAMISMTAR